MPRYVSCLDQENVSLGLDAAGSLTTGTNTRDRSHTHTKDDRSRL